MKYISELEALWDSTIEEPPKPLYRPLPAAHDFPINALGPIARQAVLAIHDLTQAPLPICAQSVLGCMNLAVQGHADISTAHLKQKPLSFFLVSVAASGERKSACDKLALQAVRDYENSLRANYKAGLPAYQNKLESWETARTFAKKPTKGKTMHDIEMELRALGPKPCEPLMPVILCSEPTFEGLKKQLQFGQPVMGLFSDEGGSFMGSHGFNDDNKLKMSAGLSIFWDGSGSKTIRQGEPFAFIEGKRVAAHLMIQPDIARKLLNDAQLVDQGLISRILVSCPDSTSGSRPFKEPNPASETDLIAYNIHVTKLLSTPLPLAMGTTNELAPPAIHLSPDAKSIWIKFHDSVESRLVPLGQFESIRGLANKLPEQAARIAATLCLFEDINAKEINAEFMRAGTLLAEYYAAEALRYLGSPVIEQELLNAQKLLDWLHSKKQEFVYPAQVYQFGPRIFHSAKAAKKALETLSEHNWVKPVVGGRVMDGMKRKVVYQVVPKPSKISKPLLLPPPYLGALDALELPDLPS